jgi:hypothetical protein
MAQEKPDTARDLDETRRLLYMSLVASKTKKYNLAGTLINALRHHQGVSDPDLEDKVISQVEGVTADGIWAREQIARINDELAAGGA